jgi:hypothetical protein
VVTSAQVGACVSVWFAGLYIGTAPMSNGVVWVQESASARPPASCSTSHHPVQSQSS